MKEPLRRPISSYSAYSNYYKSKLPFFKNHSVFETDEIKVEVEELENALLKGDVDFAFISFPKNKQMLDTTLILNDTPHIIVTADHPLAKREFVTSLDLNGLQLQAALDSVQYRLKLKKLYPALMQKLKFKDTSFTPDEIFHVFGISENTIFFKLGSLQSHSDLLVSIPIIDLPKDELYFCTSLSMRNDPRIIEIKNSFFK
ncbi:MAG: LysR family transcriptional regulator substrate-binding protein [Solobacterium sp.]|nr:LysR family transcriptional regulator substrate-binding protein [Solobacterium sp.]